jgi:hypothetical protein
MTSYRDELDKALQENLKLRQELAAKVDKDSSKSQQRWLNGWQRIGIILSILWIPVGWILGLKAFGPHGDVLEPPFFDFCNETESKSPTPNYARCTREAQQWLVIQYRLRERQHADAERLAPWFAFAPIPIAWLLVYIVVWTARWVRRGFQPAR